MDTNYDPFFSVIIPTFNSTATIAKCLQSVFDQLFTDYEVLIIDGLSTDETLSKVSAFAQDKLKVTSDKDSGVYDAMNKGIKLAKGKWFYFLGSDDTLYDNTILSKINNTIKSHQQSKIIFGNVFTSDNTIEKFTNYGFTELLDRCICHQAIFYHHSLFKNKLYSLQYDIASDWDFNLQVFKRENHPVYIDQLIANYNLQGMSGNWQLHPDYLNNFADKKSVIIRYRGKRNLYFYYGWYYLKHYLKKIKEKLIWIFQ